MRKMIYMQNRNIEVWAIQQYVKHAVLAYQLVLSTYCFLISARLAANEKIAQVVY